MSYFVHESAIIDSGALVGDGCKIWHWVHISSRSKIGKNCSLGQNVFIGNDVVIGSNVKVQNNVSVFDSVVIEDDVFCGPSMVFTNVFNPRSEFIRKEEYKRTVVKKGVTLGANCTVICGVTIDEYAFIGAGAVVNRDVKRFSLVLGVPAKQIGWMSRYGEQIPLPLSGCGEWECPHTNDKYSLTGEVLSRSF